jgi:hypothetical protein
MAVREVVEEDQGEVDEAVEVDREHGIRNQRQDVLGTNTTQKNFARRKYLWGEEERYLSKHRLDRPDGMGCRNRTESVETSRTMHAGRSRLLYARRHPKIRCKLLTIEETYI